MRLVGVNRSTSSSSTASSSSSSTYFYNRQTDEWNGMSNNTFLLDCLPERISCFSICQQGQAIEQVLQTAMTLVSSLKVSSFLLSPSHQHLPLRHSSLRLEFDSVEDCSPPARDIRPETLESPSTELKTDLRNAFVRCLTPITNRERSFRCLTVEEWRREGDEERSSLTDDASCFHVEQSEGDAVASRVSFVRLEDKPTRIYVIRCCCFQLDWRDDRLLPAWFTEPSSNEIPLSTGELRRVVVLRKVMVQTATKVVFSFQ